MTEPILTASGIVAGWKIINSLYVKYQAWLIGKSTSKEAKQLKARAEELMKEINTAILSGASSDDLSLSHLIREFKAILAKEIRPAGYDRTEEWITRSSKGAALAKKPAAKKAAAKKPAAKKAAAKKPAAKKAAAKK